MVSCEKAPSNNEIYVNQDIYELLLSSGHGYSLENQTISKTIDVDDIIKRCLPKTQHIDFFSYYNRGLLIVTTEDKMIEKLQVDRTLHYVNENKQLKKVVEFKAIYPGPFYLQNNYLFCCVFPYDELIAIDVDTGMILWRKASISNGIKPNQLHIDIEKDIYVLSYKEERNEIRIIDLSDNSDIRMLKGNILYFDHEGKKIYYNTDDQQHLFVYNYSNQEIEQIKIIKKKDRSDRDYKLSGMHFVSENDLILEYSRRWYPFTLKILFPGSDAYTTFYYYYNGKLTKEIIERYDILGIPEYEDTSRILSIRSLDQP
jgi:hypothetical protein